MESSKMLSEFETSLVLKWLFVFFFCNKESFYQDITVAFKMPVSNKQLENTLDPERQKSGSSVSQEDEWGKGGLVEGEQGTSCCRLGSQPALMCSAGSSGFKMVRWGGSAVDFLNVHI